MNKKPGYITLLSTIIVMLIVSTFLISSSLSIGRAGQTSLIYYKTYVADALTQSCIDEGLSRLRGDRWFEEGILELNSGTCTIEVNGNQDERTIVAEVNLDGFTRSATADVTLIEVNEDAYDMIVNSISYD